MLKTTLSRVFGYETFRDGQESIIQASIEGKDSCVFWATGHGKSLCYQLPAFHLKKTGTLFYLRYKV